MTRARFAKRTALVLVVAIVAAVAAAVVFVHTDYGRDVVRRQIEAQLGEMLVHGGTIGRLEGSPFGDLVARDVVIPGPDGEPAITIETVRIELALWPLLSQRARIDRLVIDGPVVDLRRDADGGWQIAKLRKPSDPSAWSIELPVIEVRRGRVAVHSEAAIDHLDDLTITGSAALPDDGNVDALVTITGEWRERGAPFALDTGVHVTAEATAVPRLAARVGEVTIEGTELSIARGGQLAGTLAVRAPAAAVRRLVPALELPGDVSLDLRATPTAGGSQLAVAGALADTRVRGVIDVDAEATHAAGVVLASDLDGAMVAPGVDASGSALVVFDAVRGDGAVPVTGTALVLARGRRGVEVGTAVVALDVRGDRVTARALAGAGGVVTAIGAELAVAVDRIELTRATIAARGDGRIGHTPLAGALVVDLTARGPLWPEPVLAVDGRIDGAGLALGDLRAGRLRAEVAARGLPTHPGGRLAVELQNLTRRGPGGFAIRQLALTAADRPDGAIAVTLRSAPREAPWLVEADAVVRPDGRRVAVELGRHRVRAGTGTDWTGRGGRVQITPRRIELRDLASTSADGSLAIAGAFDRVTGDATASIDVARFALETLGAGYRGTVDAHARLVRRDRTLEGTIEARAAKVVVPQVDEPGAFDGEVRAALAGGTLTLDATAGTPRLGTVQVALDVAAPASPADAAAWRALPRSAIRTAKVAFARVDLAALARAAGRDDALDIAGVVDGVLCLTGTDASGAVNVRGLVAPALRGPPLEVDLRLAQAAAGELAPVVVVRAPGVGTVTTTARIALPGRPLDPAAWLAQGRGALRGAELRAEDLLITPGTLARIDGRLAERYPTLRGRATLTAELAPGLTGAKVALALRDVQVPPLVRPVAASVAFAIDGRATSLDVTASAGATRLFELAGTLPVTIAELEADPAALATAPLRATARIPEVSAPALLALLGRTEVTGGTLGGTVEVAGTLEAPTVVAQLRGTGIEVPPGPGGRPIQRVENVALDAKWDGSVGHVRLTAKQPAGSLSLLAHGTTLDDAVVELTAKHFDLLPLLVFAPGPAGGAAGRLDAQLRIAGLSPQRAKIAGELHLVDARIPIAPAIGTLRRAKVDVTMRGSAIDLAVDGRLGGGTVKGRGALELDGATPVRGSGTLALRGVKPIGVVQPSVDADVTVGVRRDGERILADVGIRNATINVPKERGEALADPGPPGDMVFIGTGGAAGGGRGAAPARPTLVATVTLGPTYVKSEELRGVIRGKLTVTSDGEAIGVVGRIEADRGDLDLFGHRYQVDHAAVTFDGSTNPRLDIQIVHDFPDVSTITQVRGRLDKPELVMSSNPGIYSQGQLLGFLLGGEPSGEPGSPGDRAAAVGASLVAAKLGGYVKSALPVDLDVLRYETATATSSAAITVGTWLTQDLFLAYRRRLDARPDENSGEGEAEYWLSRRLVVEGIVGDRSYNGVDLLWRLRY
jgi:hypothetical protein